MSVHPFSKQRVLFKAYDIRGNNQLFTPDFIQALSRVFAKNLVETANAKTVVIGYDARHGSKEIAEKLSESCCLYGVEVIWLGLITTPIMAFWANQYEGHGVIATASHSESNICGIKWLLSGKSPSCKDIQDIYHNLVSYDKEAKTSGTSPTISGQPTLSSQPTLNKRTTAKQIALTTHQVSHPYIKSAAQAINTLRAKQALLYFSSKVNSSSSSTSSIKPLKVVIDCLNGATGPYAQSFFSQYSYLCSDVILLNNSPDSNFPKGNPDPMEYGRLNELSEAVISHQADIGLGFDGDGDRLMVIDDQGNPLAPDHLLYLLARVAIEDNPFENETSNFKVLENTEVPDSDKKPFADTVVDAPIVMFDVKCTHHMPRLIEQIGAIPQMSKTGSSILRRTLQTNSDPNNKNRILFAGELSGHFLFNDGYFLLHDDAMYAALRLINWLQGRVQSGQLSSLSDFINMLPTMVSTPDVYLPLDQYVNENTSENQSILKKLFGLCNKLQNHSLELPSDTRLTCIDGLRLDFAHGFGIIRPSNTSNSLTVRFVGDSVSDLKGVQRYFVKLCRVINNDLANQVANITIQA